MLSDQQPPKPAYPAYVIAATEVAGGEFVVCRGDVLGPVVARFPRTSVGLQSARVWMAINIIGSPNG